MENEVERIPVTKFTSGSRNWKSRRKGTHADWQAQRKRTAPSKHRIRMESRAMAGDVRYEVA